LVFATQNDWVFTVFRMNISGFTSTLVSY